MQVVLEVLEGPLAGRSFRFDRHDTFIVGRSRRVQGSLPEDPALSRDHFLIEINPPRCELRDLGSTNGTFVNDRKVKWIRLHSGDRIRAGQSVFRVRVEGVAEVLVGEVTPWPDGRLAPVALSPAGVPILCAGCGTFAPPGIDYTRVSRSDAGTRVQWLCEGCRVESAISPQLIPNYTTLRELGRGAMGVVYLARHNETGEKIALKLIVPESAAASSAVDRFLREVSVISQLKHPNIVEWLDQGTTRGRFWFAMEYVAGTSLEDLARADPGRYPISQACRLISQVLRGLEHAHGLGFVHRDIKPENILTGRTEAGLVAKISDFGLAKSYRSIGLGSLTFSGEMRGTIPFMPPEQVLDFKTVLPSGDLYATAATLYYLLSGTFLYDQEDDGGDVFRTLLEERAVPIQERRADVPADLAKVLDICLAREPRDRYPTAAAMRQALRPFC